MTLNRFFCLNRLTKSVVSQHSPVLLCIESGCVPILLAQHRSWWRTKFVELDLVIENRWTKLILHHRIQARVCQHLVRAEYFESIRQLETLTWRRWYRRWIDCKNIDWSLISKLFRSIACIPTCWCHYGHCHKSGHCVDQSTLLQCWEWIGLTTLRILCPHVMWSPWCLSHNNLWNSLSTGYGRLCFSFPQVSYVEATIPSPQPCWQWWSSTLLWLIEKWLCSQLISNSPAPSFD